MLSVMFKLSPVIETQRVLSLCVRLLLKSIIAINLSLKKERIEPVSTKARTFTPSIKQSTIGWTGIV